MFHLLIALAIQTSTAAMPTTHVPPAPQPDDVIARVNGQDVRARDVEALLWHWRGQEVAQEIVSYLMVAHDAIKNGVSVTDEEVGAATDESLKNLEKSVPAGQTLDDFMRSQGFSRSRLFLRKKVEMLVDRVLEKSFRQQEYVKVSTMLFRSESEDAKAVADAIDRAQVAYDRLKGGEPWDTVLASVTKDPNTLKSRGLLGWRGMDVFPEAVQAEFGSMEPGGIAKPSQTQYGVQIFRLEGHGKDAIGDDLASLKAAYLSAMRPMYVERLKAESKVERTWPPAAGS